MSSVQLFPLSYEKSRRSFLEEAREAGASLESHLHPLRGPNDEELATDVARFGPIGATRVVVINSGTHGVEGHCGSGIQRSLITAGTFQELPENAAVVLVHAINPYGFAYDRRVDHQNIDVNRNFIDRSGPPPENKAYEDLYDVLNPKSLDDDKWATRLTTQALFRGRNYVFQGTMGGQYRFPEGIQYGGVEPSWSNVMIHAVWKKHVAGADLGIQIDLHTGLGRKGVGMLMQTADAHDPCAELARAWWGKVKRYDRPTPDYAITTGSIGPAFEEDAGAKMPVSVTLEFGTRPPKRVFSALRADNWLEQNGGRDSALGMEVAERMRAAFFVDEPEWRWRVVERAHAVVHKALAALAEPEPSA